MGYFEEALNCYQQAFELLPRNDSVMRSYLLISLGILKRWQGNWEEASTLAFEAFELAQQQGLALQCSVAHALLWAARAEGGHPIEPLTQIEIAAAELQKQKARLKMLSAMGMGAH